MKAYVALLRSINVSGHNIIKMADLKQLLSGADLFDVHTYLQSGNVVFQSKIESTHELESLISLLIKERYDYDVRVKVFSKTAFENSYNSNPFLKRPDLDLKMLYYIHLMGYPKQQDFDRIKKDPRFVEEMHLIDDTIYVHYSNGFGRSKLTGAAFEKNLEVSVTARNNNTMKNLCIKLEGISTESA
ncbi:DUF1697 domain-containing protein [Lutimonas sp.]|uniref:DUF1697 domain-containing protein n=1 Tax=Lutimonas sp. TaxID=1872403 RepID=UPI003D9B6C54